MATLLGYWTLSPYPSYYFWDTLKTFWGPSLPNLGFVLAKGLFPNCVGDSLKTFLGPSLPTIGFVQTLSHLGCVLAKGLLPNYVWDTLSSTMVHPDNSGPSGVQFC